ncbi:AAA family ATPase [Amycolatopsis sp. cmx-4-54]|uniref:AAA family ATPase n=1 Tax=Amycolatopsis sp. cmx-4-54 TaxID=2790936 RepID=UPI00397B2F11
MALSTGIERIRVRNYRVLRDVELDGLTPITALLGPNGSGKSALLDATAFVHEALSGGLQDAWRRRGGMEEVRSRGATGPVEIELTWRSDHELFEYLLVVDERDGAPVAAEERLSWSPGERGDLVNIVAFRHGTGTIRLPGMDGRTEQLTDPGLLAVETFGRLSVNRHIAAFLRIARRVQLFDLDVSRMRAGARGARRGTGLDPRGDNIAMRVEHLKEEEPGVWAEILGSLRRYVPRLEDIEPLRLGDGTQIVRLRERDTEEPILPENISDGTLLLLGYLLALRSPLSVILVEEPENQVHPRLHYLLAEESRSASEAGQVILATHAPQLVDALRPDEVWMMFRDDSGAAGARRAADIPQLVAMVEAGGLLGNLWTEGYFGLGDPLVRSGRPR